ncbi:hypothetical protein B5F40_06615 [Gordonibacter sp. An230]|uniref:FhaA domain-containing protein n=1 Tax=Gordonibacter sp. An230 TaxID=1965592 RepID=UPI000B38B1B5|nr:DUF3662 and FHA domain-containing protein [Gordonibacter sp. An230]OUO90619.1 hypothetical protein B5F40_06615 [Gordonibacter sp. An230]
MGFLSKFEGKMEDTFEGAADRMFDAPISPVQIAKKAEKQMRREKMVGAGKQYAPTLYTVLVNPDDDQRLFGYYPTLAGETETYLDAKAAEQGLVMDGQPLVRFIVDEGLKRGKFEIIAEAVAAPIVAQLREEEMQRYGLSSGVPSYAQPYAQQQPYGAPAAFDHGQGFNAAGGYGYDQHVPPYDPLASDAPFYDDYEHDGQSDARQDRMPNEFDGPLGYDGLPIDGFSAPAAIPDLPGAPSAVGAAAGTMAPAVANTVAFAGGARSATPVPAQGAVHARLVDASSNRTYDLAAARVLIGRESRNDVAVRDMNASRTHAELRRDPSGVWVLSDLGSTNGTFVNGRQITTQPLSDGDRITIGVTNLVFTQA